MVRHVGTVRLARCRLLHAAFALLLAACSESSPAAPCDGADLSSDPNNCGVCGRSCSGAENCVAGACVCIDTSQTRCDYCTDLLTDPLNCGSCRRTCSGAAPQCDQGQCVCKGAVCLGVCKDTQTDPTNCGDCGVFCSLTGVCAGGKCTTACTGTPTPCDQFDPNDCGFTQWGCKAQELCVGGAFSCATFDHACTACNVQAGCSCESGTGLCKGSTSCEAQSIFSCKPYAGCSLVKKCLGTPPACETRSAKDCESVQGCTLP